MDPRDERTRGVSETASAPPATEDSSGAAKTAKFPAAENGVAGPRPVGGAAEPGPRAGFARDVDRETLALWHGGAGDREIEDRGLLERHAFHGDREAGSDPDRAVGEGGGDRERVQGVEVDD